jgi:hypothetical protein
LTPQFDILNDLGRGESVVGEGGGLRLAPVLEPVDVLKRTPGVMPSEANIRLRILSDDVVEEIERGAEA